MEIDELGAIIVLFVVLIILVLLANGFGDKLFVLTDKLEELLLFR